MPKVTLRDALELSDRLEKRGEPQRRALVDFHAFEQYKEAGAEELPAVIDTDLATKLATVVKLDDLLVDEFNKSAGVDRDTTKACLMLNRQRGVAILKKVLR